MASNICLDNTRRVGIPITDSFDSERPTRVFCLEEYLELLDWTGYVGGSEERSRVAGVRSSTTWASKWVDAFESLHSTCGLVVRSAEAVAVAVSRAGRH